MAGNIISNFNQFLSAVILFLWSFLPHQAAIKTQIVIPAVKMENAAPNSITMQVPKSPQSPKPPNIPWGTTEKLGEHQYRTYVANDPTMGTPDEILTALNFYRKSHNSPTLRSDENICKLAQSRAAQQQKIKNLDNHQGLMEYMDDPNHWKELNITAIGENASYGYVLSGTHLIEWVFDSDSEHRENQLNPQWNISCAGISEVTVNIIFGKR